MRSSELVGIWSLSSGLTSNLKFHSFYFFRVKSILFRLHIDLSLAKKWS